MGASAGAVEALSAVLPGLPADFPVPLLVVVHQPNDKASLLVELFSAKCRLRVGEAEDKEPMERGVYFAPPGYHLLLEKDKTLALSCDEPVLYSRPSIDVLFESAADALGPKVLGVILTGANSDGAEGLSAIHKAGGCALVQSPETAQVPAMPAAALEACPQARALTLEQIARFLEGIGKGIVPPL